MTNSLASHDRNLLIGVVLAVILGPILLAPFGAGYPDLMQKFVIFGIFAIGFNILFGLTGYLSFGHAAFLGAGSYAAVWSFKLFTMNVVPAIIFAVIVAGLFALLIGFISLRRSGIYFSILTLAFAQMSYKLAYSVLTPITNGETGLQLTLDDPRILDGAGDGSLPLTTFFGLDMNSTFGTSLLGMDLQFNAGYYVCGVIMIAAFYLSLRIFRSPFGLMLHAVKSNQNRMQYTGLNTRPYTLAAFVISGMYAGLAGGLLAATDPLAGAERMQWTASGEVVLMTILGGAGTLIGPLMGAGLVKYFENIFSSFNHQILANFYSWVPEPLNDVMVWLTSPFVGEGWHLTLGVLFMAIVIFLPGGLMEGANRVVRRFKSRGGPTPSAQGAPADRPMPAE